MRFAHQPGGTSCTEAQKKLHSAPLQPLWDSRNCRAVFIAVTHDAGILTHQKASLSLPPLCPRVPEAESPCEKLSGIDALTLALAGPLISSATALCTRSSHPLDRAHLSSLAERESPWSESVDPTAACVTRSLLCNSCSSSLGHNSWTHTLLHSCVAVPSQHWIL